MSWRELLSGHFPLEPGPVVGTCVWCGKPTDSLAMAPGLGRELPLDVDCGWQMIVVWRRLQRGLAIPDRFRERARLTWGETPLLSPGDGPAETRPRAGS